MFLLAAICMALVGHLSTAVPLESPPSDLAPFFESRIVGGSDAPPNHSPYIVALVVGYYYTSFSCGGSLISDLKVLTAAHCIFSNWWDGQLMETYHGIVGTDKWNHGGIPIKFSSHVKHPEYDSRLIKSDVAVITLTKRVTLSARVAVIALDRRPIAGGEACVVTGWGTDRLWGNLPAHLQILYIWTIDALDCQKRLAAMPHGNPGLDPKVELCTFHSPGHGMCHGDSGSPLVSVKSGKQIGLVSWGIPCAVGGPDVFGSVHGLWPFILEALKASKPRLEDEA